MANYKVVDADRLDGDLTAVADAIREKTGAADALVFPEDYVSGVGGLHTFTPPGTLALDPEEVYRTTRPADWLPMPVPGDDEIYMLGMLMEGVDNQFLIKLAFTGNCTVEFGTLVDGVFTAKKSAVPVSDVMFYHGLNYEDYGNETAEGFRQYLVRIQGAGISKVEGGANATDQPAFIVDFACGIPLSFNFSANGGQGNSNWNKTFCQTRYLRFLGNGSPGVTSMFAMHSGALKAVTVQGQISEGYFTFAFSNCRSLQAIDPELLRDRSVAINYAFDSCALSMLPDVPVTVTNMSYAFNNSALQEFHGEWTNTAQTANLGGAFSICRYLREVRNLDISSATNVNDMFTVCVALQKLTFAGSTTPGGWTISLTSTKLSHTALVRMLESLPAAVNAATITITGNPGALALTDEEIAIATAKNWTVTI